MQKAHTFACVAGYAFSKRRSPVESLDNQQSMSGCDRRLLVRAKTIRDFGGSRVKHGLRDSKVSETSDERVESRRLTVLVSLVRGSNLTSVLLTLATTETSYSNRAGRVWKKSVSHLSRAGLTEVR